MQAADVLKLKLLLPVVPGMNNLPQSAFSQPASETFKVSVTMRGELPLLAPVPFPKEKNKK